MSFSGSKSALEQILGKEKRETLLSNSEFSKILLSRRRLRRAWQRANYPPNPLRTLYKHVFDSSLGCLSGVCGLSQPSVSPEATDRLGLGEHKEACLKNEVRFPPLYSPLLNVSRKKQ